MNTTVLSFDQWIRQNKDLLDELRAQHNELGECPKCDGVGTQECPLCGHDGDECSECNGTGKVKYDPMPDARKMYAAIRKREQDALELYRQLV